MQHPNPQATFSLYSVHFKSIKRKRNSATPGFNVLTYAPYKWSKSLQNFVVKLASKIWGAKVVPADWAQAFIMLLSKSNEHASVAEFRAIAITSTIGKIFFSIVAERLQFFMIKTILFQEISKKVF